MVVRNTSPYAGYVYGGGSPLASVRQVPGHMATGWGADMDAKLEAVSTFATNKVLDGWGVIVEEALKR